VVNYQVISNYPIMKTGLIHTTVIHRTIYYKLKRQVVLEFQPQM
jgi:hypothetical protein